MKESMKGNVGRIVLVVFMLIFHVDQLSAQQALTIEKIAGGIKPEELKKHLEILAYDSYEGRETGTKGQKMAAQYIADYYTSLGIEPCVNGSWFQSYPLKRVSHLKSYATMGAQRFEMIKDFYFFGSDQNTFEARDIVFVGYGIKEGKHNDYKNMDVKGKTVMCLTGEPLDKKGRSRITGSTSYSDWSMDPGLKIELAATYGAKNVIVINTNYDAYMERVRYWLEQAPMRLDNPKHPQDEEGLPTVFISVKMADLLLQNTGTDVKKYSGQKKQKPLKVSSDLVFHMEREENKLNAENVLCFIEGSDPLLKKEIVVISAHYDHIGIVNGQINNGADDDGSGTVAALELAQAFAEAKKSGLGPKRSILILNVSGEEKGLLGSEWYSDFPVFPLENTVCDLNIDMIGRKDPQHDNANYVYLIGSDKLSTTLHQISENCNKQYTQLTLDYTYNDPADPNRFYYRSDHYNFAKHNIPVIFYFSGVHEDYHKPGDDVEKILFDKMAVIARLVFYTAWEVANREERLKVDVQNDFGGE